MNMRRFNFDDSDEGRRNVNDFLGDDDEGEGSELTPEEYEQIVSQQAFLAQMQLESIHKDLSQRLLSRVIRTLEKSNLFWRFYSHDTQLKMIAKTYRVFENLLFGDKT